MQSSFCWVIQLFSLVCTVKGYYDREWERQGHILLLGPLPLSLTHVPDLHPHTDPEKHARMPPLTQVPNPCPNLLPQPVLLTLITPPTCAGSCPSAKEMLGRDQDCLLPVEEAGVLWDSVCFLFLLLQRRVFLSYYFLHVRAELQATALQASRLVPI